MRTFKAYICFINLPLIEEFFGDRVIFWTFLIIYDSLDT